jgi:outer membrane receptor protein involved in Fe transport
MTNPSAKYKPDAEAGIINIILKKGTGNGFNGGFTVNAGNDDRYNGDVRVDYSHEGINMYGSYSPRQDNRTHIQNQSVAEMSGSSLRNYYEQDDTAATHHLSHLILAGGDMRLDEANTVGLSGSYFGRDAATFGMKTTERAGAGGSATEHYVRIHNGNVDEPDYSVKGFLRHDFDRNQRLRFDFKTARDRNEDVSHFTTVNLVPQSPLTYDNTTTDELGKKLELSIDYNLSIDSVSSLEAGYSGERNSDDMDLYINYFDPAQQSFVVDTAKTNHFVHNETIHSAYATYERRFGLFGFKLGLRAEQVFGSSELVTRNTNYDNDYFNLYPTLHLAYRLNETMELQSNYSRRIYRPEAEDLNPFPDYSDPTNLYAGNPLLLPMYIHSLEFGCLFQTDKVSFLPMLFYRYKYNRFTNVTTALNDSTLYTTVENLTSDHAAGVEFVLSGSVTSFISTNANADIFFDQIDASALGFGPVKSIVTWRGAMTCDFLLSPTTRFQLNPIYRAARLTPAGEDSPYFTLNLGIRQDFMERRLSLLLSASDVFKSWKRETDWTSGALSEYQLHVRDSRIIYFGLTYHLGVPTKESKKETLHYDDQD